MHQITLLLLHFLLQVFLRVAACEVLLCLVHVERGKPLLQRSLLLGVDVAREARYARADGDCWSGRQ